MNQERTTREKVSVMIADDEPLARSLLKKYIDESAGFKVIAEAGDGADALKKLRKLKPQVIFLDIQMPELNGFDVIDALNKETMPVIVFVTSYSEYAVAAFEKNAVDYILKPFTTQRLNTALEKLEAALTLDAAKQSLDKLRRVMDTYRQGTTAKPVNDSQVLNRIMVKTPQRIIFIDTQQVFYFEAEGDYVAAHTVDKRHLVNYTMQQLEEKLPPGQFVRIHRSAIINTAFVSAFIPHFNGEYYVQLQNGKQLKTSRNYKQQLKQAFGDL